MDQISLSSLVTPILEPNKRREVPVRGVVGVKARGCHQVDKADKIVLRTKEKTISHRASSRASITEQVFTMTSLVYKSKTPRTYADIQTFGA